MYFYLCSIQSFTGAKREEVLILAFQKTFGNSHSYGGKEIDPVSALNVAYICFDEIMDMQFDGDGPSPSIPGRVYRFA